jgi:hypothetical protein
MKEYNINKKGLVIDNYYSNADQTCIVFNGRIDNRLWIGYYDMQTKSPLLDWTDDKVLETTMTIDVGYGEIETYSIENYHVNYYPCYNEGTFSFKLSYSAGNKSFNDLYFIRNGELIKLYNQDEYAEMYAGDRGHDRLSVWYRGFITGNWCFDTYGEKLFELGRSSQEVGNSGLYDITNAEPVSYEEAITFNIVRGWAPGSGAILLNTFASFSRLNLQSGYIWTSDAPLRDIISYEADARLDDFIINKSDDNTIWEYIISYTQRDGTKGVVSIELNLDTGSFETHISTL